jgi:hypothetical protein
MPLSDSPCKGIPHHSRQYQLRLPMGWLTDVAIRAIILKERSLSRYKFTDFVDQLSLSVGK